MHITRWLGAFGRASDVCAIVEFEKAPRRHVSVAVQRGLCAVGRAAVGLTVDTSKTKLVCLFGGDAMTPDKSKRGDANVAARDFRSRRWEDAGKAVAQPEARRIGYAEALVANPVYTEVVYADGDAAAFAFAQKIGALMGLPLRPVRLG